MRAKTHGLPQSIQTRLASHARSLGVETELVLTRYAVERFLYRLSRSPYAERFILKGALLMLAWFGETIRPTRDADLLGFGELSDGALAEIFREVCVVDVEPDAVTYDRNSLRIDPIRDEDVYGGRRVKIRAQSGAARLRVQVDVGIGDAVSPGPEWLEYPSLLDLPRPRLMAYRPETFIAEKVHAMVLLGSNNSRMRDFFDIYTLTRFKAFDANLLAGALRATFERRRTAIPDWPPSALKPGRALCPPIRRRSRRLPSAWPNSSNPPSKPRGRERAWAYYGAPEVHGSRRHESRSTNCYHRPTIRSDDHRRDGDGGVFGGP